MAAKGVYRNEVTVSCSYLISAVKVVTVHPQVSWSNPAAPQNNGDSSEAVHILHGQSPAPSSFSRIRRFYSTSYRSFSLLVSTSASCWSSEKCLLENRSSRPSRSSGRSERPLPVIFFRILLTLVRQRARFLPTSHRCTFRRGECRDPFSTSSATTGPRAPPSLPARPFQGVFCSLLLTRIHHGRFFLYTTGIRNVASVLSSPRLQQTRA